jgi:hypothetical protein
MGRQELSSKVRDYELGYAPPITESLTAPAEAMAFLSGVFDESVSMNAGIMKLVSPESQVWAFGQPGEPGDPERIEHLARRLVKSYELYLDLVAKLRSVGVPGDFRHLFELAADFMRYPVNEIGNFLETIVRETDSIPGRLSAGEPVTVIMHLILHVDDTAAQRYFKEQRKLRRRFHL